MWGKEGDRVLQNARGSYAPYQVRNRTGTSIFLWSDVDGNVNSKDRAGVTILHDQTVDWRFDDWKAMREVEATCVDVLPLPECSLACLVGRTA